MYEFTREYEGKPNYGFHSYVGTSVKPRTDVEYVGFSRDETFRTTEVAQFRYRRVRIHQDVMRLDVAGKIEVGLTVSL